MNIFETSSFCRCCLSQPMNLNDLSDRTDMDIVKAIQDVCGININLNIYLPHQICDDCLECLNISHRFRIRTQQSDKTLQGILEGSIIVKELIAEKDQTKASNQTDSPTAKKDQTNVSNQIVSQSDDEETIDNDHQQQVIANYFDIIPGSSLQCRYCQTEFIHLKNLRVHMQRHFNKGKFSCSHCSNSYHTKFDLQRHMTTIHSDGYSFECELCDKEFPTKPELNRHLRIHDEKKPFSCSVCGKHFKLQHNAQQHLNSYHQRKMSFFCELCGKGFAFACKLKNHKKCKCKRSIHISVEKMTTTSCETLTE